MRVLVVVTLIGPAVLLAACTKGPAPAPAPQTHGVTVPVDCANAIGTSKPPPTLQIALGAVALPSRSTSPALQTGRLDGGGPWRLFAKSALLIRPDRPFVVAVPKQARGLAIGWGESPNTPSRRVAVDCHGAGTAKWVALIGGYWVDQPECATVIVRQGGETQRLQIGIGKACPGQEPPQGPSQT